MSLYRFPEVYATLLYPEPDLLEALIGWIEQHLEGDLRRLMDPCCGPATWLLPFAVRDVRVAGNDKLPEMIGEARRRLCGHDAELTTGDMRVLRFRTGPFDVVLNLHGSVGHLRDDGAIAAHLRAVAAHLRPEGLYFLGLAVFDGEADDTPWVLYESDPLPVPSGGMAAVRYESVRRDPVAGKETIRLHLMTEGVRDCPERLVETYVLRTLSERRLRAILERVAQFDLVAVHAMEEEGHPEIGLHRDCGDVTLILRRRDA